jgi:hypothetical protein
MDCKFFATLTPSFSARLATCDTSAARDSSGAL